MYHCIDHCWVTSSPCPIQFTGTHLYMWVKRAPPTESNILSPNSRLQPRLKLRPLDPESSALLCRRPTCLPYNYRESSVIAIYTCMYSTLGIYCIWWVKWNWQNCGNRHVYTFPLSAKNSSSWSRVASFGNPFCIQNNKKCKIINLRCSKALHAT